MLYAQQFESIDSFCKYINTTPINEAFTGKVRSSVKISTSADSFTQTGSFDEALQLLHDGWSVMAERLTQKLKASTQSVQTYKPRNVLNVAGGHPIVPLYLTGVPNNMIDKQLVMVKSKVINIVKSITYSCSTTTEQIVKESVKSLQIVKALESQGYRVNLYVAFGVYRDGREIACKIRIKGAGEKLNVSKVTFPLVHPSMLRRLMFKYVEVEPNVTSGFVRGYGYPMEFEQIKRCFQKDIVLPAMFNRGFNPNDVKDIDTLQSDIGY